jgi:hypothetical protein
MPTDLSEEAVLVYAALLSYSLLKMTPVIPPRVRSKGLLEELHQANLIQMENETITVRRAP